MDTKLSQEILEIVRTNQQETVESTVPWFYANMPPYYFKSHTKDDQIKHLHAIISSRISGENQTVVMQSPCGAYMTYITPGIWVKELLSILDKFHDDLIQTLRIMSSRDSTLRVCDIQLAPQPRVDRDGNAFATAMDMMRNTQELAEDEMDSIADFLSMASPDYVGKFDPARALRHYAAFRRVSGKELVEVTLEQSFSPGVERICVNMSSPPLYNIIPHIVRNLARQALDIDRAYADLFEDGGQQYLFMSLYTKCRDECLVENSERWERVKSDLERQKWQAPHGMDTLCDTFGWPLRRVAFLQAASEFAHQFLTKKNFYAYTSDNIVQAVLNHKEQAERLVQYFEARFDPKLENRGAHCTTAEKALLESLDQIPNDVWRELFMYMYRFVRHTLRTNYFVSRRMGLGFRLEPEGLIDPIHGEVPYGVYFFHGPRSLGFHVRFRDTARGGLRIVPTSTQNRFEVESNRLFDEVAALARTQQDKNKDIPEGGAKAVLLLGPQANTNNALKSMINSLLDLMLPDGENHTGPEVVDYLGKREVIFLGPDENITSAHINWIVARANKRGYAWPSAFMSSKPKTGINHKEYGVTSLGVVVFVEEVLAYLGIDPHQQRFTVKLTGGPRGDVASNVMTILWRKYGDNACFVSMSDGSGGAYDPNGLDREELTRLISEEKSIAAFDVEKLSNDKAFVVSSNKPEGARIRNSLHNTVEADVFIPAGGRPDTINMDNWTEFFKEDGTPSAKAMVEGANIFISRDARQEFENKGIICIQGSSANKTGVICSSYEILAGLALADDEFEAIKPQYVEQVLAILEKRARDEARLMIREYKLCGRQRRLTDISLEISREINTLADRIVNFLVEEGEAVETNEIMRRLTLHYCPDSLSSQYEDRIFTRIPLGHRLALLGHFIASRIVYSEGLAWLAKLAAVTDIRDVVMAYLEGEAHVEELCEKLEISALEDREELKLVLHNSGRKFLTMQRLGLA